MPYQGMPTMGHEQFTNRISPATVKAPARFDANDPTRPGPIDPSAMGTPAAQPQATPDVLEMLGIQVPNAGGFKEGFMGGIRGMAGGIGPAIMASFGEASRTTAPWEYTNPYGKAAEAMQHYNESAMPYQYSQAKDIRDLRFKAMNDPQIQEAYNDQITGRMPFQQSLAIRNETEKNPNVFTTYLRKEMFMSDGTPKGNSEAYEKALQAWQRDQKEQLRIRGTSTVENFQQSALADLISRGLGVDIGSHETTAKAPFFGPRPRKVKEKTDKIRVRRKSDGKVGMIDAKDFNEETYERAR